MQQLQSVWASLSWANRAVAVAATVATLGGVYLIAAIAGQPRMALLYGGLDPVAAGEIVTELDAQGVVHEVRGGSIFVDAAARDSLRMTLAAQGKPASAAQGYELLDELTGFGTTSRMFDATYWRAKEGELARTIMANPGVQAARVHISNPARDAFSRREIASASVAVAAAGGGRITPEQAAAFRHLVASAVAGLRADEVSVIDGRFGLVPDGDGGGGFGASDARAEVLRKNALRLLEARVGPGRAIVEVTVDTANERETISERVLDPDDRVAISQETEERKSRSNDRGSGAVTVASNLPDGAAGGSGTESENNDASTREITNYDVSETRRELVREPGSVRRMSVAVLVDGITATAEDGTRQWSPRPEAELADLRDLVATAVGIDEARGDSLTVRSMQFEPLPDLPEPPPVALTERLGIDTMRLAQLGILGLVTLLLGLFVIRPILRPRPARELPAPDPAAAAIDFDSLPPFDDSAAGLLPAAGDLDTGAAPRSSPTDELRRLIEQSPGETIEVLGQWMNPRGEATR